MSRKMKRNCQQIMKLLLMLLLMTFVVFPFLVCLSHTFKYEGEINSLTPHLLPHQFTLNNLKELFEDKEFFRGIFNSFKISLITMLLA